MLNEYTFKIDNYSPEEIQRQCRELQSNKILWAMIQDIQVQLFQSWAGSSPSESEARELMAAECRALTRIEAILKDLIDRVVTLEKGNEIND